MASFFKRSMSPEEIKRWRKGHGMSQLHLAECLRIAKQTVSNWETGRTAPPGYLSLALRWLTRMIQSGEQDPWARVPDRFDLLGFRDRSGWSQGVLARNLRVSPETIRQWENGTYTPPEYLSLALAELATKRFGR